MDWLLSPFVKFGLGLTLLAVVAIFAYRTGRADERAEMLKAAIEAYEDRETIEDDIASDDPVALCRRLGGLPDECATLRGLAEDSR